MGFMATEFVVSAADRAVLEQWVRSPTVSQEWALRAKILLATANGESVRAMARRLEVSPTRARGEESQPLLHHAEPGRRHRTEAHGRATEDPDRSQGRPQLRRCKEPHSKDGPIERATGTDDDHAFARAAPRSRSAGWQDIPPLQFRE